MKNILTLCFLVFICQSIFSQSRIAIYDIDENESRTKILNYSSSWKAKIPDYLINFYANDDRFIVIDRKNDQLIKDEKERQKSEDFIDGYIVEQGVEEGIDFILRSWLTENGNKLNVRFYDVKNNTVLCEKNIQLTKLFSVVSNLQSKINELAHEVNLTCFKLSFEVVRQVSEKKGKTKEILVLAGYSRNVSKGQQFEIFEIVEETVQGNVYTRQNIIGEGIISEIQDQNFSIIKIKKGGDIISEKLASDVPLYCKY